ncbi:short-chain dehydrogenase [Boudabousia liubingyangii]|uniref:Short-chain dehydrogenase n=1 Tax=Boudabousia liubingyangii TaxID=1921764 RepID=A0A1Q5PLJ8_9ACTO|nr:SDR family NAD(P)-dependent oxidoreductase [Boudabousia liubingyangii]OKL46964.1 short-chain dehydrogenase [Boudabousia liubingyangii]OKL47928.1 short-chain dehydrogenase [Boudabousia liubingyangii]
MGTALITGATSGIGEEFAWQLAAAGHDLVIVARRTEVLEQLAEKIRNAANVNVEVLPADLADREQLQKVADRLADPARPVGLLVNNAGMALGQHFVTGDLAREELALDLMVKAPMVLSQAAGQAMSKRGRGAILNVSSIASRTAYGTYAAHKAWLRSFSEGLDQALRPHGVTVTALMPGWVHTGFHDAAGLDDSIWPWWAWINVEKLVRDALTAVRRGRAEVVPSVRYQIVDAVLHHAPRPVVKMFTGKVREGKEPIV